MDIQARLTEDFLSDLKSHTISNTLYDQYKVKKGLRNEDGTGVVVGLTRICDVVGYKRDANGAKVEIPGELVYRGYSIEDLYHKFYSEAYKGLVYERACYLLLMGELPDHNQLQDFHSYLGMHYSLPQNLFAQGFFWNTSPHLMNQIQAGLLTLYKEDPAPDNTSIENLFRQGLNVLAKLPMLISYSYLATKQGRLASTFYPADPELGIAEQILYFLLGPDQYGEEEVRVLDLLLMVHADHGIGNNSTFTGLVVSSTGTDLYSAFTASVASLKGPKHGGANIMARSMMEAVMEEIGLDASDDAIEKICTRILNKDFYDKEGIIYGFGHAVYTVTDPRCHLLKEEAMALARKHGKEKELDFYWRFEETARRLIMAEKGKSIATNVDFYSGFIYSILGIDKELFTPFFVQARLVGWLSHIIEEKYNAGRIIRPAGFYVGPMHNADDEMKED